MARPATSWSPAGTGSRRPSRLHGEPGGLVGQLRHRPQGGADQDPRRRAEGQRRRSGGARYITSRARARALDRALASLPTTTTAGPLGVVTGRESSRACAPRPSTAAVDPPGAGQGGGQFGPGEDGTARPERGVDQHAARRPAMTWANWSARDDGVGPLHRGRADVGQAGVQLAVDGVVDRAGEHASTPRSRRWRRGWRLPRRRPATAAPAATAGACAAHPRSR